MKNVKEWNELIYVGEKLICKKTGVLLESKNKN